MTRVVVASIAFLALTSSAFADGMVVKRHHHHHHYRLPPARHVVERVSPPGSGLYLLNGGWFRAESGHCSRWVAGDRVRLVDGDWDDMCPTVKVRNLSRRMTCELTCARRSWW